MPKKGCLQHLTALHLNHAACFLKLTERLLCVYVILYLILLSLQNFFGVTTWRNATFRRVRGGKLHLERT